MHIDKTNLLNCVWFTFKNDIDILIRLTLFTPYHSYIGLLKQLTIHYTYINL